MPKKGIGEDIMNFEEKYFIGPRSEHEALLKATIDLGLRFMDGSLRENKVLIYKDPKFFLSSLSEALPIESRDVGDTLLLLEEIGKYSIAQSDLNYLAFPDSGNSLPAMMWSIFSKFINQNLIAFDRSAPIASIIEIQLIEWLRELIGYESKPLNEVKNLAEISGMCTTGGHMSNHVAILSALNHAFPQIRENGISWLGCTPVIFLSKKISHYSIESAVCHLWIGKANIIDIPTLPDFTTDFTALDWIIQSLPADKKPFMIVSVSGNTRTSSLDDISKITPLCKKYNLWHHVDACHGGSLLFSEKLKAQYLDWIDQADSVTIDPHKWLFVTYPSSFVLFKKRNTLTMFSRYAKECEEGEVWDLGFITPFLWSRWFESLWLWLLIKIMWFKWIETTILDREKNAKYAERLIIDSGDFVTLNRMDFYRMAFVFCPKEIHEYLEKHADTLDEERKKRIRNLIDTFGHQINQKLYESWKLCLDEYKLHDVGNRMHLGTSDRYMVMAITIWNPLYSEESLKQSLSVLFEESNEQKQKLIAEFKDIVNSDSNEAAYLNELHTAWPAGW